MTLAPLTAKDLENPIVEEVRCIKRELSARYEGDSHRMFEDMRKAQFASGHVVVTRAADGRFVPVNSSSS